MLDPTIEKLWLQALNREDYELYLHSPFCVKPCKYCVYTGKLITEKDYKEAYDKYVQIYLPQALDNYNTVFSFKTPKSLYVGGGTPNLIKADDLQAIFKHIPSFNKIPCKIADIHPAYLNEKVLKAFAEAGFSTLCFGIQSFDEETLNKNNRDGIDLEKFKHILSLTKQYKIYTSIDLMCYLNYYSAADINILKNDIDIAMNLDLDFIAVNPNLHFILDHPEFAVTFNDFMDQYLRFYPNYISEKQLYNNPYLNERSIYRIINKNVADIYRDKILPYFADDFPYAKNNIIGVGDLHNRHSTMSYIHQKLYYVERNINWTPTYDIKYIKPRSALDDLADMLTC